MVEQKKFNTKIISVEVAHQNPHFSILKERFIHPLLNQEFTNFFVQKRAATMAIPEEGDSLHLVKQYRQPIRQQVLQFPVGVVDEGEDLLQGAKRELTEEAHLEAKEWDDLGHLFEVVGWGKCIVGVFLARGLSRKVLPRDPQEKDMTVHKLTIAEIKQKIQSGEINDSLTIAAFYKYLAFKGSA